jgi:hypothetical protein
VTTTLAAEPADRGPGRGHRGGRNDGSVTPAAAAGSSAPVVARRGATLGSDPAQRDSCGHPVGRGMVRPDRSRHDVAFTARDRTACTAPGEMDLVRSHSGTAPVSAARQVGGGRRGARRSVTGRACERCHVDGPVHVETGRHEGARLVDHRTVAAGTIRDLRVRQAGRERMAGAAGRVRGTRGVPDGPGGPMAIRVRAGVRRKVVGWRKTSLRCDRAERERGRRRVVDMARTRVGGGNEVTLGASNRAMRGRG